MARSYDAIVGAGHAREYINGNVGTDKSDKNVDRISVAKSKNFTHVGLRYVNPD
jgi:hypothetical protein